MAPHAERYIALIAAASLVGLYISLMPHLQVARQRAALLVFLRIIGTVAFAVGLFLGWFQSASVVLGVVVPVALYFLFIGCIQLLLRGRKAPTEGT